MLSLVWLVPVVCRLMQQYTNLRIAIWLLPIHRVANIGVV